MEIRRRSPYQAVALQERIESQGWPRHWLDRHSSLTAVTNSVRLFCSCWPLRRRAGGVCRFPCASAAPRRSARACWRARWSLKGFFSRSAPIQAAIGVALSFVCWMTAVGADNQQATQVAVSLLRDTAKPGLAAGRMLLWRQPEPGGELPAGAELAWIGHGGSDCGGGDDTQAGYRGEPAARFALRMPGSDLPVEFSDLPPRATI